MSDSPELALQILCELTDGFSAMTRNPPRPRVGRASADFAVIHGLTSHAMAAARAIVLVNETDTAHVAFPGLTRTIFECGVQAQWVARDRQASAALLCEFDRQRRALAATLKKSGRVEHAEKVLASITGTTSPKAHIAKHWTTLCDQFELGDELYSYYRRLSAITHAGIEVAEMWLGPSTSEQIGLHRAPRRMTEVLPLAALGLVLAEQAHIDLCAPNSPRANKLNRLAKPLELPPRLRLANR